MTIRVLHIFSPDYKRRFGGPTFTWKYCFSNWNEPDVSHYVLDTEGNRIVESKEAFHFEYPKVQKDASRWERAMWIFPLFRNLIKYKGDYDIVHLHVLCWGSLFLGPWAKWNRKPLVYESVLLDSDTPGGIYKQKFGKIVVWFMRFYKAILAISEYLAEDYRKFGFPESQVFSLVNFVDDKLFSPVKYAEEKKELRQRLNLPSNAIILIFVGSVIERKGVDILIQAYIEAVSKCPDLFLVIVGPKNRHEQPSFDEDFVNDLYALLDKNNLSDRVLFTGLIQDVHKLGEIYRASDIFVFPSRKEGLGNVVLEAMACGLPVLVSQLPVLDKIIKHGENGMVVPIGDADALCKSILLLSGDSALAGKIGGNAHSYVEKKRGFYAWQTQLVKIYHGMLS